MNYKVVAICCGLILACVGCKSTANQSAESQPAAQSPVVNQPVPAHISSKRVYDTSYIPPSLYSKVNSSGDGYINKSLVVNELLVDGKVIYEVIDGGASNYFDIHGAELAGAERTRILSQVGTKSVTR